MNTQTRSQQTAQKEWYSTTVTEVIKMLQTTREGLTKKVVSERRKKYGENKLPEKKPLGALTLFINQFKSAFVYILLVAAIVSYFLHEAIDGSVILLAVIINVVVGFFQERKAQKALEAMQKVISQEARVKRNGSVSIIPAVELVPGDVVILQSGDKVPADMRLVEVKDLEIAEAGLTGESAPVKKQTEKITGDIVQGDQVNMAFMSTVVTLGTGVGIVTNIGTKTAIGRIAELVKETEEDPTPLQEKLDKFSKRLGLLVLILSAIVFIVGIYLGHSIGEMFTTSVAIAVSAIPEGLVVALTVILAIGMRRILKEKGLVKKLLAAETLGSTSVICSDKTGTLTQGEMRVVKLACEQEEWTPETQEITPLIQTMNEIMMLNNNAEFVKKGKKEELSGSPTERALLMVAGESGIDKKKLERKYPKLDEIPFDSSTKYMMTLHKYSDKENIIYIKGASEVVLSFCSKSSDNKKLDKKEKKKVYEKMSKEGLRVLSVAYARVPSSTRSLDKHELIKNATFAGFIGLQDPLRPDAKEVIALSKQAGVATVMITGDHKLTAQAIAKELGLPHASHNIITGAELKNMNPKELKKRVPDISVFARVSPEDKLKIVDAWQERGQVVAMTGDGVNDAPALKKADIGVAVGSGTDVAKETADLILLDDDFKTIVSAIEQGRVIYDNAKKVILYFLSDSFSEMILVIISLFLGWPLPILASQILWVNLVDDTLPSLALTQEPEEKEIMSEPPEKEDRPVLDVERKLLILLISTVTAVATLSVFWLYWRGNPDNLAHARTIAFVALGVDSLLYIFSVRTLRHPIWKINLFSNMMLIWAIIVSMIMQVVAVYVPFLQKILQTVPLSFKDWGVVIGIAVLVIFVIEVIKWLFMVSMKKRQVETYNS